MQKAVHNYGIDMLRIICMIQITGLHILGHGGIIEASHIFSINYETAWLLKCSFMCAVNCYAMISGYVLIDNQIKFSNIFLLWLEVICYSIVISFGSALLTGNTIEIRQLVDTLLPVIRKQYWYPTVYIGMYFIIPYMNLIVNKLTMKQYRRMLLTVLIIISLVPTLANYDLMDVTTGSITWLITLYFLGAFIKKYGFLNFFPRFGRKLQNLKGYLLLTAVLYMSHFVIERIAQIALGRIQWGTWFILYTSPLVVLQALSLFNFLITRKFCLKPLASRMLIKLSSCSLAVYLVQDNIYFKNYIGYGLFSWMSSLNPIILVFYLIIMCVILYLIVVPFELLRKKVIKTMGIESWCIKHNIKFNQFFNIS